MKYIIILISIVFLNPQSVAEDTILDKKTHYSNSSKTIIYEIPIESGVMIDTEFEFEIVKSMFKKWYKI